MLEDYKKAEEDISKLFEDHEKELGARPKEFKVDFNKDVDLDLLDADKYNTPQEVFDFFYTKSNDPDKKMIREEIEDIINNVSADIKALEAEKCGISRKKKTHNRWFE